MGDLERLSTVKFVSSVWRASSGASLNDKIKCPDCRQSTREICDESRNFIEEKITLRQRVRLNICRACHLGWMKFDTWTVSSPELDAALVPYSREYFNRYAKALVEMDNERTEFITGFEIKDALNDIDNQELWRFGFGLMFLIVTEDADKIERFPVVTWILISATVLIGLFSFWSDDWAIRHLAVRSSDNFLSQTFHSFSSFFVHAGLVHLAENMFGFWVFAPKVEDYLGKSRFLILVFLSAWLGAMMTMAVGGPAADLTLIGASTGVFGVMLFYCLRFWYRRILVFRYIIPAWIFAVGVLFLQGIHFLGKLAGSRENIAYAAHLGGALVGIIMAFAYPWSPVKLAATGLRGAPHEFERETAEQINLLQKIRKLPRRLLK